MFNFDWSELALIAVVALVLIGPKDMPIAIRAVSNGIKKMRRMAGELQGHVDEMVREADLGEARDTFRDLRSMNLRSQVMRTLDEDGTLGRTLSEKPLAGANILGRRPGAAAPPAAIPAAAAGPAFIPPAVSAASAAQRDAGAPAQAPGRVPPAFIPPRVARSRAGTVRHDLPEPGAAPPDAT